MGMPTKRGALGLVKEIEPTPAGCGMRISGSVRNCVGLRRNVPKITAKRKNGDRMRLAGANGRFDIACTTDRNGAFRFAGLAPGAYLLSACSGNDPSHPVEVEVRPAKDSVAELVVSGAAAATIGTR